MAHQPDFFNMDISREKTRTQDPFFTVKDAKDPALLEWLMNEVHARRAHYEDDFAIMTSNLKAYLNHYNKLSGKRQSDQLERLPLRKTSKYTVNHLYEITESIVASTTRIKPAVEVIPTNDEFEDKNSAKIVKLLIDHLFYINDIDRLVQKLERGKLIFGTSYTRVDWDKHLGDKVSPSSAKKTGDVCIKTVDPRTVLPEICDEWEKCKSIITSEKVHVKELELKYPNIRMASKESDPMVEVFCFEYKHDEHCPEGAKILFTEKAVLERGPLGHSHGELPLIRITDIDIPGRCLGASRYQQVMLLQNAHNNLSQTFLKSEFLMGAPKWVVPKGSINLQHLSNGHTVLQYQGPVPPQLVTHSPTAPSSFNFREKIELEIAQLMGKHPVSRGPQIKSNISAVALQFLNEQENERNSVDISKHNKMIQDLGRMIIAVAGDYYKPDDKRMIRVVGKENKYMTRFFDSANLNKPYDIRIQTGSAFPQSKAARIERVLQTMQYAPQLFTPERWAELLEFGSVEKMHTLVTEAIRSAESQVEDILEGKPVAPPEEHEDLITHLRVYYKAIQKRSFKEEVPLDRRERMIMHIEAAEMLAAEKAQRNPLFAAKLSQLEQFPMYWEFVSAPPSPAELEAQASRGESPRGEMPAEEPADLPGGPQSPNKIR